MKKRALLAVVLVSFLFMLASCIDMCKTIEVEASIVSINKVDNKLNETIGQLLRKDRDDTNQPYRVGVSFKICDELFLADILVEHAYLSYYRDQSHIPLTIYMSLDDYNSNRYRYIKIQKPNLEPRKIYLTIEQVRKIYNCYE